MASALIIVGYWQYKPKPNDDTQKSFVGFVLDANTDAPIRNAKVTLEIRDVPPVTYTDSEGHFSFPVSVHTPELQIRIQAEGYENYNRRIVPFSNSGIEYFRIEPLNSPAKNEGTQEKQISSQNADARQATRHNSSSKDSQDNQILSFRVVDATDRKIEIEVWYFYNGTHGNEYITIGAEPLDIDGKPLTAGSSGSLGEVRLIGNGMTRGEYTHRALKPGESEISTKLRLCMSYGMDVFECQEFSYRKIWK